MAELQDYQPVGRRGAITVRIGNYLYMWGGSQVNLPTTTPHNIKETIPFTLRIEIFNLLTGKWEQRITSGNPPLGIMGYAATAVGNEIYYFGGHNGKGKYSNSLTSLNVDALTWREITPIKNVLVSDSSYPSKKEDCAMISVTCEGETYLIVMGGTGPVSLAKDEKIEKDTLPMTFMKNDVHQFHLKSGQWLSLEGHNRSPCNSLSLTPTSSASKHGAVMAGCHHIVGGLGVYFVSFTRTSVSYKRFLLPSSRLPHNVSSVLIDTNEPHLLLIGINGGWRLDIFRKQWYRVRLPPVVTNKYGYSLSVWKVTSDITWIIQCGGLDLDGKPLLHDIVFIELSYTSEGKWFHNTFFIHEYMEKLQKILAGTKHLKRDIAVQVIHENFSRIKETLIGFKLLSFLADKLMEKRIINERIKKEIFDEYSHLTTDQRMDSLLNYILASIKLNEDVFTIFVDILRQENLRAIDTLVDELLQCYRKLSS